MSEPPVVRLASLGQVYVTLAAAERHAAYSRQPIEQARRELTAILLSARLVRDGEPSHWRFRSNRSDLDISATVAREGPLWVVLSANVRRLNR